jgi:hypothetical protein
MTMVLTSPFPGGGDDDFLGTGGEVSLGFLAVGEQAGGFNDDVHAERLPREGGEVFDGADALDLVAVDHEDVGFFERGDALFRGDGVLELAMHRIIFHLVGEVVGIRGHVHDGDDIN